MFAGNFLKLLRAPGFSARTEVLRHVARPSAFAFRSISSSRVNYAGRFVYLGNLPWNLLLEEIKDRAEQFGALESITMPDDEIGRFAGFANVEFHQPEDAEKFYSFAKENDLMFQGRRANVHLFEFPQTRVITKASNFSEPNNALFIGNIPRDSTEEELEEIFSKYGDLTRISINRDSNKYARGFAHVQYKDVASAEAVVRSSHESAFFLGNRRLRVDFAEMKKTHFPVSSRLYFNHFLGTVEELKEALADHASSILNIVSLTKMNGIIECESIEAAEEIRRIYDRSKTRSGHNLNIFFARPSRRTREETSEGDARRRTSYGSDWGGSHRNSEYGGGLREGPFDHSE